MLLLEEDVHLEKCLCCGLPKHMIIKPTKKLLRYHAYCPYCRFSAFLRKSEVNAFRLACRHKKDSMNYSTSNNGLFLMDDYEFEDLSCMFCSEGLKVKKCASKNPHKRMVSFGCKDCFTRFFVPVIFLDFFYVI